MRMEGHGEEGKNELYYIVLVIDRKYSTIHVTVVKHTIPRVQTKVLRDCSCMGCITHSALAPPQTGMQDTIVCLLLYSDHKCARKHCLC